jgi:hypothetical protein
MKNIHLIPTDKPNRLTLLNGERLLFSKEDCEVSKHERCINQHIYITNDEEIKEGDYILDNILVNKKPIRVTKELLEDGLLKEDKKIILTTDQDLIKDGVQTIDETFLKWFVKNPSCEFVDIERGFLTLTGWVKSKDTAPKNLIRYKIIIPKEEPKQEWNPTQGEEVWMKVFSNWLKGTYIGYDVVKQTHIVREEEKGGGHLFSSIEVLPYYAMPNEPQQETLEQSYQRGYERGLNALIPLIENLNKEITELKRKGI